jgi:hypothetical protein
MKLGYIIFLTILAILIFVVFPEIRGYVSGWLISHL